MSRPDVAILFARRDSIYHSIPGCDVYDADRDARTFAGGMPVVSHPPCRAWGRLAHMANPAPGEMDLARWAVDQVRQHGGVLEHPAGSRLWADQGLPPAGAGSDAYGGWTLGISQHWWGHRAEKRTLLYIVGCPPSRIPRPPIVLGRATHVIAQDVRRRDGTRARKGDPGYRPRVTHREREATPPALAHWLVELARRTRVERSVAA